MPKQEIELATREPENIPVIFNLPPAERVKQKITEIDAFQSLVRQYLKPGLDYGIIPGTGKKPTLLKPGAEKVDKLLDLCDNYDIIKETEDWNKPFFYYLIRCELRLIGSNILVSSGMGSCNSMESKYRYRWLWPSDVPDDKRAGMVTRTINVKGRRQIQYRTDNDDIYSIVNTILKMAKKRAHIDATLSAARLSELFTQDVEDLVPEETLDNSGDEENDRIAEEAAQAIKAAKPALVPQQGDPIGNAVRVQIKTQAEKSRDIPAVAGTSGQDFEKLESASKETPKTVPEGEKIIASQTNALKSLKATCEKKNKTSEYMDAFKKVKPAGDMSFDKLTKLEAARLIEALNKVID